MPDTESLLNRWQSAGVLDANTADRIRAYEALQAGPVAESSKRLGWQGRVALILGAILLASGVVLFVSAHWDQLSPGWRYTIVMAMVAVFHLGGAIAREKYHGLSTALHAVGTISTGAAIALVGQIFNIQEHWPAAILMWAVAALAGWILLRDQAQQTLTLLLFPAWIVCEWSYSAQNHIGVNVYIGRFLIVWAVLYLTVFLASEHKVARAFLFAAAAIASVVGVVMLLDSWIAWSGNQSYLALHTRVWGWVDIVAVPIFFSFVRLRKSTVPVLAAIAFAIALPWCTRIVVEHYGPANAGTWGHRDPNLAAHALVAAFCIFIIWWGVRQTSRSLVNLGIIGFAVTVAWFFFSNIFDKMGRSLGLIGLGVLFLAGGWLLEKTRRSLLAHMAASATASLEAQ
jgi:uncharacterized membrane protein